LAQEYVQRIMAAAGRMDKLILDVLQYSQAARSELTLSPVDVEVLLRGIIESYPAFNSPQVQIRIDGSLPRVLGNEAALTQCFSNLLDNAVKFVAPGVEPKVRIWAREVPECEMRNGEAGLPSGNPNPARGIPRSAVPSVRFWVEDNGIGIPKAAQDKIFKLFHRLNQNYEGTGVGLAVVRKTIEKMGGDVGLESEPGQGARFWLQLRLAV
jgi:signal transduction histidine kinase